MARVGWCEDPSSGHAARETALRALVERGLRGVGTRTNQQWEVNVMAHVFPVRAVLPATLERESGYLLHTASMAGILTTHGNLPYAITKHAVVGLAEWLSITYHDKGIRVSLCSPR